MKQSPPGSPNVPDQNDEHVAPSAGSSALYERSTETTEITKNEEPTENAENMDIHHTHGSHHQRKTKDYIFEFFMLFLAITAGFFMENMREAHVENHREHQYMNSLISDIREDTASIRNILEINKKQIAGIDSILNLMENPHQEDYEKKFYHYVNTYLGNLNGFSASEVTITQLRNSGGMRLIGKKMVSDSIVSYYGKYDSHTGQQKYNIKFLTELVDIELKILDLSTYRIKGKKLTIDNSMNREFYNRTLALSSILTSEVEWLKSFQKKSISLLEYLKREYKVE